MENKTVCNDGLTMRGVTVVVDSCMILDNVTLDVAPREYVSVLGKSGAGKTTLLQALAGHRRLTDGVIYLHGLDISSQPPHARPTSLLCQDFALFPHLTARDNVAFPLRIRRKLDELNGLLDRIPLPNGAHQRKPDALSGGEQQRVALLRALACEPKVLLLDEPAASLDPELRLGVQALLRQVHKEWSCITLHVTHSVEEALSISDRVLVLDGGRVVDSGGGQQLFERPATVGVARLLGHVGPIGIGHLPSEVRDYAPSQTTQVFVPRVSLTTEGHGQQSVPVALIGKGPTDMQSRRLVHIRLPDDIHARLWLVAPRDVDDELRLSWPWEATLWYDGQGKLLEKLV